MIESSHCIAYQLCEAYLVGKVQLEAVGTSKASSVRKNTLPRNKLHIWTQVKEYPYTVGPELIPGGTTWGTADGSSKEVVVKGGSAPAASGSSSTGSSSSSSENTTPIDQPTSSENTTTVEPVDPSSNQGGAAGSSAGKDCDVQYVERSVRRSFTA